MKTKELRSRIEAFKRSQLFEKRVDRYTGSHSFVPPYVYMALPDDDDNLFEPRCSSNLLEDRKLEIYFRKLAFAIGIVDALDLNTRIWGEKACV